MTKKTTVTKKPATGKPTGTARKAPHHQTVEDLIQELDAAVPNDLSPANRDDEKTPGPPAALPFLLDDIDPRPEGGRHTPD